MSHESLERQIGFELVSLSKATHYQNWIFSAVSPYLGNRILEIGAGIGNLSQWLPVRERLLLSEVDPMLLEILKNQITQRREVEDLSKVSFHKFDIFSDSIEHFVSENLDTIVSFNVLEHIEDDYAALEKLASILVKSGARGPKRLITFVPAHQWAYGEMDRRFGHYRRYSRNSLINLARRVARESRIIECRYFNLFSLPGWVINGRLLRRAVVGTRSIEVFNSMCPWIRGLDDFLHQTLKIPVGQSLLLVLEFKSRPN